MEIVGILSSLLAAEAQYRWAVVGPEILGRQPEPDNHDDHA